MNGGVLHRTALYLGDTVEDASVNNAQLGFVQAVKDLLGGGLELLFK